MIFYKGPFISKFINEINVAREICEPMEMSLKV
jgi:hypothetical protein